MPSSQGLGRPEVPALPKGSMWGIWYILKAQRGSHIPTLRPKYIPYTYFKAQVYPIYLLEGPSISHIPTSRPKYIPYTYMDPLGSCKDTSSRESGAQGDDPGQMNQDCYSGNHHACIFAYVYICTYTCIGVHVSLSTYYILRRSTFSHQGGIEIRNLARVAP